MVLPSEPPPRMAETDAILMMRPARWRVAAGIAAFTQLRIPATLTRATRSHSDAGRSANGPVERMPAALTRISSRPAVFSTRAKAAKTAAASATSTTRAVAACPWDDSIATALVAAARSRSASHTEHPSLARAPAMASPMPAPAPVTAATRPFRSRSMRGTRLPTRNGSSLLLSGLQPRHNIVRRHIALVHVAHGEHRGRADHADNQDVGADQPRLVAAERQQRCGDDRRQAAREYSRELIDERDAGVAHPRIEQFREQRGLRPVDRRVHEGERHGNRQPNKDRRPR